MGHKNFCTEALLQKFLYSIVKKISVKSRWINLELEDDNNPTINTHTITKPIGPPITNEIPLSKIIKKIAPPDNPDDVLAGIDGFLAGLDGFLAGCFLGLTVGFVTYNPVLLANLQWQEFVAIECLQRI